MSNAILKVDLSQVYEDVKNKVSITNSGICIVLMIMKLIANTHNEMSVASIGWSFNTCIFFIATKITTIAPNTEMKNVIGILYDCCFSMSFNSVNANPSLPST